MQDKQFVVYKSSAGSGKTFTLVKEYLKLALADKNALSRSYRGILAITFTNKAASEMKWRIIKALKEISSGKGGTLGNLVSAELQMSETELQQRASAVLTDILHNYSDFSIGTIDSFTHRIIRTFALDLKLPVNFQIETDSDTVFKKVINLLISNLGKDQLVTDYLTQYSLSQLEENKNWDPENSLIDFIKEINKEGINDLIAKLSAYQISDFEVIKKQLKEFIRQYEAQLKQAGEEGLKLIHSKNLTPAAFYNGASGIYNFFVKLATLKETSEEELFKATVLKTLNEDKWYGGKISAPEQAAIDSIKSNLQQSAESVLNYIRQEEKRYNVFKLIYRNIYAIGLVNELAKLTTEFKAEENILFISEFNERIFEVVNHEPTPFIFERLGDRYKHFLLDEFQDTSSMQWQNMLPLIDNALAGGRLNLIVGDGKQSIYRWRNADVAQFVNLPQLHIKDKNPVMEEREDALVRNYVPRYLEANYRSKPVVVQFNNTLFGYLAETVLNEDLKKIYEHHAQKFSDGNEGYVSIDFPFLGEEDTDAVNTACVLKYIQQAVNDGYKYSDICIIVRQNRHGNTISNFLIEQNIPVVSAESLLLDKAEEVNVILSFLKYAANHKDLVSASVVITHLWMHGICTHDQYIELLRLINTGKRDLFGVLQQQGINIDKQKVMTSSLYDACVEIIQSLELNKRNPQYIRFFLDELLLFLQANTSNVSLFIEWWERRSEKASVIIPEGIDAVNVMTIHASKGLEFPVVITPYLAWDVEKTQSLWVDVEDEELNLPVALIQTSGLADKTIYQPIAEHERQQQTLDTLNLLYVDFTRAVDRLHIISPELRKNSRKNCHAWLQAFAATQQGFDAEANHFETGTLTPKAAETHHKNGLSQLQIAGMEFTGNDSIVEIKGASSYQSSEEITKAREYGILVHYILSQVKYRNDLDEVIRQTYQAGDITESEAGQIRSDILQLLNIKAVGPYFEPGAEVKNEVEILSADGTILRPDRVVIENNTAVVIDYKTGKKNPAKYHLQMKAYEQALLSLGYKKVKKLLLYIHEQEAELIS